MSLKKKGASDTPPFYKKKGFALWSTLVSIGKFKFRLTTARRHGCLQRPLFFFFFISSFSFLDPYLRSSRGRALFFDRGTAASRRSRESRGSRSRGRCRGRGAARPSSREEAGCCCGGELGLGSSGPSSRESCRRRRNKHDDDYFFFFSFLFSFLSINQSIKRRT